MSVIFMLGWFWYGILGFVGCLSIIWCLYGLIHDKIVWSSHRNRDLWLLHHFGPEGAKRWLVNEMLVEQHDIYVSAMMNLQNAKSCGDEGAIAWRQKEADKAEVVMRKSMAIYGDDCFMKPRRMADGSCRGLVDDVMRRRTPVLSYDKYPPWDLPIRRYSYKHALTPWQHEARSDYSKKDGYHLRHGEPRGSDWLAAGFWDVVTRGDDFFRVGPLDVMFEDMVSYWVQQGAPFDILDDDGDMAMRAKAAAYKRSGSVRLGCN